MEVMGSPSLEDFKMLGTHLSWMAFLPTTEAWTERSMGSLPTPQFCDSAQGGLLALLSNRQRFQGIQHVDLIAILQSAGGLNQFLLLSKGPQFYAPNQANSDFGLIQFIQRLLTAEGAT